MHRVVIPAAASLALAHGLRDLARPPGASPPSMPPANAVPAAATILAAGEVPLASPPGPVDFDYLLADWRVRAHLGAGRWDRERRGHRHGHAYRHGASTASPPRLRTIAGHSFTLGPRWSRWETASRTSAAAATPACVWSMRRACNSEAASPSAPPTTWPRRRTVWRTLRRLGSSGSPGARPPSASCRPIPSVLVFDASYSGGAPAENEGLRSRARPRATPSTTRTVSSSRTSSTGISTLAIDVTDVLRAVHLASAVRRRGTAWARRAPTRRAGSFSSPAQITWSRWTSRATAPSSRPSPSAPASTTSTTSPRATSSSVVASRPGEARRLPVRGRRLLCRPPRGRRLAGHASSSRTMRAPRSSRRSRGRSDSGSSGRQTLPPPPPPPPPRRPRSLLRPPPPSTRRASRPRPGASPRRPATS